MRAGFVAAALIMVSTGCTTTAPPTEPFPLSGMIVEAVPEASAPAIGIVADSQLQTRANFNLVRGYRGKLEDWAIPVSIRPPALDWAARSMLRSHLAKLKAKGAEAIFYLGDGANNGCVDEFSAGFEIPPEQRRGAIDPNDEGLLTILDSFRHEQGIPVYFAIGNHDILGAGSTSKGARRTEFCADEEGKNDPLLKIDVIRLVDRFNRGNDRFAPRWSYASSYAEGSGPTSLPALCGRARRQHRRWGCYLAGRVDYRVGDQVVQFLLLDTNDWVNVSESSLFGWDQEGLRGAMSFGAEREGIPSQTGWFMRNASNPVAMRIAMTHYHVRGLMKNIEGFVLSRKSQEFMSLFTTPEAPRKPNQNGAYVISAHTHKPKINVGPRRFSVACGMFRCDQTQRFSVGEMNVGSTTDYSNYSTLVWLAPEANGPGALSYRRIELDRSRCPALYAELDRDGRWASFGIDPSDRGNYRSFGFDRVRRLGEALKSYVGTDANRANCIGLFAAALEKKGIDPYTGRPRDGVNPPPRRP